MPNGPLPAPTFDQQLLERAKSGPNGVVEVYDRYADRLYAYFFKRCRQRELAEDLTSQVFVRFLKALPTLEWRGLPLEAWLFRTASNALIDHWRKIGTHFEVYPDGNDDDPWDPPSHAPGPAALTELELDGERLRAVMVKLSPRDQEALDLRYFAELEPMEIGELLGISANHASVLVYRALARLRALYHKTYANPTPSVPR